MITWVEQCSISRGLTDVIIRIIKALLLLSLHECTVWLSGSCLHQSTKLVYFLNRSPQPPGFCFKANLISHKGSDRVHTNHLYCKTHCKVWKRQKGKGGICSSVQKSKAPWVIFSTNFAINIYLINSALF